MPELVSFVIMLGFVTIVLALYMLITRSAGIYATPRQFWMVLLLSAGIAYLLSGSLFLFLHLSATIAVAVSAVVPFLVGNLDLGDKTREPAPTDAGLEAEQPDADDEEADALEGNDDEVDAEAGMTSEERGDDGRGNHIVARGPGEMGPFWN